MNRPDYVSPQTLKEALSFLEEQPEGARVIAGGTDLIPRMRAGMITPTVLVDLRQFVAAEIEQQADIIRIGARASHTAIAESGVLLAHCPALVEAARDVAGPPIRNRGTVGGNLVNASPAADLAPPLLVYDASVVLASANGERELPLAEFFTGPGQTILAPGEILTEIRVPQPAPSTGAKFIKMGTRNAMAVAVVSVAARLTLADDGSIAQARIALGSVAPTPLRAVKAEQTLAGAAPGLELFADVGQIASAEASPISDIRASGKYRKQMVAVLTKRALTAAWDSLGESN